MDERLREAQLKVCLYLFLGALLVRLLYLSQYATSPFFWVPALDSLYHDLLARAIARGQSEPEAFFRAPLYYYFLGGVYWLFGHSFWAARVVQAVIGSLSCVLLYLIGRRLFRPSVGLLAGAAMALYGPLVFFDGELLTPVLELFLVLSFVLLAVRANESGSRWEWLAAGGALGMAAITRPNALVAVPLAVLWIANQRWSNCLEYRLPSACPPLHPGTGELPESGPHGMEEGSGQSDGGDATRTTRRKRWACLPGNLAKAGWGPGTGCGCPAPFTGLSKGQTGPLGPGNGGDCGRTEPVSRAKRAASARGALAALFLIGVALAPALVTYRNYQVSGDPVFIASQGGINLFLGNRPGADGFTPTTPRRYRFEGPYEDSVALYGQRAAEEATGRQLSASEAQSYWVQRVFEWWRDEPLAALKLTGKKWVLAWTHREVRNNHAYDFIRSEFAPLLWLCPFGFWLAGPLGLLGMGLAWRQQPRSRWLILLVPVYVTSFVLFFVADRYRLPVVPLLLLFSAHAVVWAWERLQCGELRRLASAAATLAGLACFVGVDWYRTATPATWALDHWSAGNRHRELGRLPEAEAQFRKALTLDSGNADIWLNLGGVQYYSGRLADAAASFRQSLQLAPANSSGHFNLAMCELEMGRRQAALEGLQQALRLEPEHTAARAELARLQTGK